MHKSHLKVTVTEGEVNISSKLMVLYVKGKNSVSSLIKALTRHLHLQLLY